MERYRYRAQAEAVQAIMGTLPAAIRRRLAGVHVVTDFDPAWLGLHSLDLAEDGRSYKDTAHCVWACCQLHLPVDRRETTLVLYGTDALEPDVLLHEMGHALDERLNFNRPAMAALTSYAATNQWEAFAVAFRAWCNDTRDTDNWWHQNRQQLREVDRQAAEFFDRLAVEEA